LERRSCGGEREGCFTHYLRSGRSQRRNTAEKRQRKKETQRKEGKSRRLGISLMLSFLTHEGKEKVFDEQGEKKEKKGKKRVGLSALMTGEGETGRSRRGGALNEKRGRGEDLHFQKRIESMQNWPILSQRTSSRKNERKKLRISRLKSQCLSRSNKNVRCGIRSKARKVQFGAMLYGHESISLLPRQHE